MEKSLEKIEKALASPSSAAPKATGVLSGLSQNLNSLLSSIAIKKFDAKKANNVLDFARGLADVSNSVDPEKAKGFGEFMGGIGSGLEAILKVMTPGNLIKLSIGSKIIKPIISRLVEGMSSSLKGTDAKELKEGGEAIKYLAEGLSTLSKALGTLALIGLVAPIVAVGALVTRGVIALFTSLGKSAKDVEAGGKALGQLGKGLIVFSAGLATFMLLLSVVSPTLILEGIAVLASFAVTFALLGAAHSHITEGGKSIGWMGLGLFAFSAALATYMLVMMLATPKLVLEGIGVLVALGTTFALLGKFEKSIAKGGEALLAVGLGLISVSGGILAFGIAIKLLEMIFKEDLANAGLIAGGILLGLGGAFSVIGLLNKGGAVDSGAQAMNKVGLALLAISGGIFVFGLAIKLLDSIFKGDLVKAGVVAGGILAGLGIAFGIIGAFPTVAVGAASMISVGIALLAISGGIMLFGLALKGLQKIFGNDLTGAKEAAGGILLGLGLAFAGIGLLSPVIIPGAVAGILMGGALLSMSAGIWTFGSTLSKLYEKKLIDDEGNLKGIGILSNLMSEFAKMFFTSIFAVPGIVIATGMGMSLMVISKGLKDVGDILDKVDGKFVDKLFDEDSGIIYKLAKGFELIGERFSGGFLSSFFGTDPVSLGIRTVRGFGDVLQELAGGIVAFADFSNFPVKVPNPKDPSRLIYKTVDIFSDIIPSLNENLPALLTSLSSSFATIGNLYGGDSGWFGEESPVKKGINAVSGLGSVLSELAGGIVSFASFDQFPVKVPDSKDPSKLIYRAVNLFDVIPKIKEVLVGDGTIGGKGILFSLANVFAKIGEEYPEGFFTDSSVKQGVDAVKGIGSVISELAGGILSFATLERGLPNYDKDGKLTGYTPFTGGIDGMINAVKTNVTAVLESLPSIFATIDIDSMEEAKEKADLALPLAESIAKIGKAIQSLLVEKGEKEKVNMIDIIGPSLKTFVEETNKISIEEDSLDKLNSLAKILDKFSGMGDGLKTFADSLSSAGKSFLDFSQGFGTFSAYLDKFVRFEGSFGNLVKNQQDYKFDKFAESMGILKNNVNSFNVENLRLTDSMMKSLAILSKSPDALGEQISESLDESFKKLVDAIKQIATTNAPVTAAPSLFGSTETKAPAPTKETGREKGKMDATAYHQLLAKLETALSKMATEIETLNRKVNTVNGSIKVQQTSL